MLRFLLALLSCQPIVAAAAAMEQLTLVAENDWSPYASDRQGHANGLAVDLIREAYQAVGVQVQFRSMPYARCMKLVEVGREIGCFNSLKDASTESRFLFGKQALFTATIGIYGYKPEHGVSVASLAGKRVGLTHGYTYGSEVELDRLMIKETAGSDLANLRKLAARRLDYVLIYSRVAAELMQEHRPELYGRVYRVGTVSEYPLYVSFSRRHPRSEAAMQQLDRGLSLLMQNGRYAQLLQQWQD